MSVRNELRNALEDAIRRAYCEPLLPPAEGEDADTVRALARAALISDPNRMRHLVAIQAAAWATVEERVEDEPSTRLEDEQERLREAGFTSTPENALRHLRERAQAAGFDAAQVALNAQGGHLAPEDRALFDTAIEAAFRSIGETP